MNEPSLSKETSREAERSFRQHATHLWGLAYRMLGVGADADEVVQEAFVRFLRTPPLLDRPVRPWLVRVTMNLARDRLRRRRDTSYVGPWLPAPAGNSTWAAHAPSAQLDPGARYSELESLSLGFLLAAEKLSETARAVMVLRDVFGYSVRDVAALLEISESNVKVTAHRARQRMGDWEQEQRRHLDVPHERVVEAMRGFFMAVMMGDRAKAESMLAADVLMLNDGGGEFFAARKPVIGAAKVAGFYVKISSTTPPATKVEEVLLSGRPAVVIERAGASGSVAPRAVVMGDVDVNGLIQRIYTLIATPKLRSTLGS